MFNFKKLNITIIIIKLLNTINIITNYGNVVNTTLIIHWIVSIKIEFVDNVKNSSLSR